jgi:hypothetical protein
MSHDVSFFPKEGRVGPFDHLKLAQELHGVYFGSCFMPDLGWDRNKISHSISVPNSKSLLNTATNRVYAVLYIITY